MWFSHAIHPSHLEHNTINMENYFRFKLLICSLNLSTVSTPRIKSAAFSAIIIVGAFVFPDVTCLITEASTTRSPRIPLTLKP